MENNWTFIISNYGKSSAIEYTEEENHSCNSYLMFDVCDCVFVWRMTMWETLGISTCYYNIFV